MVRPPSTTRTDGQGEENCWASKLLARSERPASDGPGQRRATQAGSGRPGENIDLSWPRRQRIPRRGGVAHQRWFVQA